jgi:hypothetical protein
MMPLCSWMISFLLSFEHYWPSLSFCNETIHEHMQVHYDVETKFSARREDNIMFDRLQPVSLATGPFLVMPQFRAPVLRINRLALALILALYLPLNLPLFRAWIWFLSSHSIKPPPALALMHQRHE